MNSPLQINNLAQIPPKTPLDDADKAMLVLLAADVRALLLSYIQRNPGLTIEVAYQVVDADFEGAQPVPILLERRGMSLNIDDVSVRVNGADNIL